MKIQKLDTPSGKKFLLNFVTSCSIILFCFLLVSSFLYYSTINNAEKNIVEQNTLLLDNAVKDVDSSMDMINTLNKQISSNLSIAQLSRMTTIDKTFYLQVKELKKYLTEIMALSDALHINGFFIYFPNTDRIVSSSTSCRLDLYYSSRKYDSSKYDEWANMIRSYDNLNSIISLNPYKNTTKNVYFKVKLTFDLIKAENVPILCVELSPKSIQNQLSNLFIGDDNYLFILDENQEALFQLGNLVDDQNLANDLYDLINFTENNKIMKKNGDTFIINKSISSYNNWIYYYIQKNSPVLDHFYTYKYLYLCILIFAIILILVLFIYLLNQYMNPLVQINSQLENSQQENQSLQIALNQQRPYVYNAYMARLMTGRLISDEDQYELIQFLHMDIENKSYGVLYCQLYANLFDYHTAKDSMENLNSNAKQDLSKFSRNIVDAFHVYFGEHIYLYKEDIDSYSILIAYPSEMTHDEFAQNTKDKFFQCKNYLENSFGIVIFGGLGKRNNRLPYIWESYQQAKEAIEYAHEDNPFQIYKEIERENNAYYYPLEIGAQLTTFIKSGNKRQVVEIFKILRRENYEFRSLPIHMVRWLLSDIRNTLVKIRYSVEEKAENQSILSHLDKSIEDNTTIDKLEQVALSMCELFESKEVGNQLINTIQEYIDKNYTNSSICLKKISEEFNISESYFSYLFKEETRQNFSDYLEYMRMEKAMFLVKTTDIPLSELYLEVGYNNSNSFRRAFKKVHGVSPKTVRDNGGIVPIHDFSDTTKS